MQEQSDPSDPESIDLLQWRALLKAYLVLDYGGLLAVRDPAVMRRALVKLSRAWFGFSVMGLASALFVLIEPSNFSRATGLMTMTTLLVAMVTVSRASLVMGSDDLEIIGFHPVTARTHSFVKMTVAVVLSLELACLSATVPLAILFVRSDSWTVAFAAALGSAAVAVVTGLGCLGLYNRLSGGAVGGVSSLTEGMLGFTFLCAYFTAAILAMSRLFPEVPFAANIASVTLASSPPSWLLLFPPSWFATYVELADGTAPPLHQAAAALSVVLLGFATLYGTKFFRLPATRKSQPAMPVRRRIAFSRFLLERRHIRDEWRAASLMLVVQFLKQGEIRLRLGVTLALELATFVVATNLGVSDHLLDSQGLVGLAMIQSSLSVSVISFWETIAYATAGETSWLVLTSQASRSRLLVAMRDLTFAISIICPIVIIVPCLVVLTGQWSAAPLVGLMMALSAYFALQVRVLLWPDSLFSLSALDVRSSGFYFKTILSGFIAFPITFGLIGLSHHNVLAAVVAACVLVGFASLLSASRFRRRWPVE